MTLLRQRINQHFSLGTKARARIQPETERTLAFAPWLKGTCMSEAFLLLSCGAAFITGIVIAAASLFGQRWAVGVTPVPPEGLCQKDRATVFRWKRITSP